MASATHPMQTVFAKISCRWQGEIFDKIQCQALAFIFLVAYA
ncbi:hypothetical protein Daes_2746 [Pseudodesulfovibrio aespoeensis Aspo-2]|uniref:Uncharacterized protein n=1 Tax=Pseudodesulfovibrio aespoeensis (strain ATCC 700646 / DSM 10631 / Aspo-2) TaxID=643562 RepID=E6VWY0_PSEA9|nr:hypothetical protein Daes_2746 [Pseudodesulfovibrio aespoeensis Aspo-2]